MPVKLLIAPELGEIKEHQRGTVNRRNHSALSHTASFSLRTPRSMHSLSPNAGRFQLSCRFTLRRTAYAGKDGLNYLGAGGSPLNRWTAEGETAVWPRSSSKALPHVQIAFHCHSISKRLFERQTVHYSIVAFIPFVFLPPFTDLYGRLGSVYGAGNERIRIGRAVDSAGLASWVLQTALCHRSSLF